MKDSERYYLRDDGKLFMKKFEVGQWRWYGRFPLGWGKYHSNWQPVMRYMKRIKYEDAILELI